MAKEAGIDSRQGQTIFLFSIISRPALGLTKTPIQWVLVVVSLGVEHRGMKLSDHLHLVLRLRIIKLYLHSLIYLHGMMLNYVCPEIPLPFILHHKIVITLYTVK
jgi:hypothetical protein